MMENRSKGNKEKERNLGTIGLEEESPLRIPLKLRSNIAKADSAI